MNKQLERVSFAGALVTLGIVYGDIGTSPLYVMNALIGDAGKMGNISPNYVIGSISLIFLDINDHYNVEVCCHCNTSR